MKNPLHQKRKLKAEGPIEGDVFVTRMIGKKLVGLLFQEALETNGEERRTLQGKEGQSTVAGINQRRTKKG